MNRRRSIRLKDYDYSAPGAYLITICSHQRKLLFGDVVDERMIPSDSGNVVSEAWNEAARRFPSVELDAFVVMPNHVHGIIFLVGAELAEPTANYPNDVGAGLALPGTIAPPSPPTGAASGAPTLGDVVRVFKSISAIEVNRVLSRSGQPLWQRNYYDHVIRDEASLLRIREYIATNPLRWQLDRENPDRIGEDDFDRWLDTVDKQST